MIKQTTTLWLYTYWDSVRNGRRAPLRLEIEPAKLGPVLPETFILEYIDRGNFRFRLAGTRICEQFGFELKGRNMLKFWGDKDDEEAVQSLLHSVRLDFSGGLIEFESRSKDGRTATFELLFLPLIHTGTHSNRIMGSLSMIDSENWAQTDSIESMKLTHLDLIWPDTSPQLVDTSPGSQTPVFGTRHPCRIVEVADRRFRVFDGGLKD